MKSIPPAKAANSVQTTAFQTRFSNFVALSICMTFSPRLKVFPPLGQTRNAGAMDFRGYRDAKHGHMANLLPRTITKMDAQFALSKIRETLFIVQE